MIKNRRFKKIYELHVSRRERFKKCWLKHCRLRKMRRLRRRSRKQLLTDFKELKSGRLRQAKKKKRECSKL